MTAVEDRQTSPRTALIGPFGGLFFGYLGLTAAIPVLPGFVRDRYSAIDFLVGLVITATAVTALLVRPIAGGLADSHGYRLIMQLGALVLALGGLAYFLPIGLPGLVVDRLLLGIGEAALFTAGAVWVVSVAPHDRRGQIIGLYGVSMWGGISAGTFLGALLHDLSYSAVWAVCAVSPLIGLALIRAAPAPVRPAGPAKRAGLMLRPALSPGLALATAAGGYAALAAFVVLLLQARGIHSGVLVLSCYSAVYAGTRLVIGHFPDKYGPRPVATVCAVVEAIGLLVIAVAPNLAVAILGSVVMGVGFSLLHPSLALMVMNRTEKSAQGAALGAYTSFWDLGLAVWGPLGGAIAGAFGYQALFVVVGCCAGLSGAMALLIAEPAGRPVAAAPLPPTAEPAV
jgi:MFS family permease